MAAALVIVPFTEGIAEAARLVDAQARPLASILDPGQAMEPSAFRAAVLAAALKHHEREAGEPIAGILFATRWGGGGVMLT
jgi:hypothetical protein